MCWASEDDPWIVELVPGVDAQQDRDAVTSSPGNLRGGDPGVELQRHDAVPQVTGPGVVDPGISDLRLARG